MKRDGTGQGMEKALEEPWRMPSTDRLLDVDQVAQLLNVKRSYVYGLTSAGRIPFIKIGNHLRFRRSGIEKWLDEQMPSAPEETSPDHGTLPDDQSALDDGPRPYGP